jgi:hypothetical protein
MRFAPHRTRYARPARARQQGPRQLAIEAIASCHVPCRALVNPENGEEER